MMVLMQAHHQLLTMTNNEKSKLQIKTKSHKIRTIPHQHVCVGPTCAIHTHSTW